MPDNFANRYASLLNGAIDDDDTSLVVDSDTGSPDAPQFRILVQDAEDDDTNHELMIVTAKSGTTFTVTRGAEGTTAVAHGDNSYIAHVLTAGALGAFAWALPTVGKYGTNFSSASTSLVVTMSAAPVAGECLNLVVGSGNTRGPNAAPTQTNVTWTQRYQGSSGTQFLTIYTGVVSGAAGTAVTINFTGSGTQQADAFTLDGVAPFTSGTVRASNGGTSALPSVAAGGLTSGRHFIGAVAQSGAASSYQISNHSFKPFNVTAGAMRLIVWRLAGDTLLYTSPSNTSTAFFTAIVEMT